MKIYQPLTASYQLNELSVKSESDIHCVLYARLKQDGFRVSSGRSYKDWVAFDIVLFSEEGNHEALAIIEVKRENEGHRIALDQTEQGFKYRQFGVPVILFWDLSKYDELVKFLKSEMTEDSNSGDDLRIETNSKSDLLRRLRDLHRRLDTAQMAAFDAKSVLNNPELLQMEITLEKFRDKIQGLYETI